MAIPAYMWIKDDQGSEIEGSVSIADREGSIEVLHFDHELRIPTDGDTGSLTGTRKHEPLSSPRVSTVRHRICTRLAAMVRP